jgi:hypothetical protein
MNINLLILTYGIILLRESVKVRAGKEGIGRKKLKQEKIATQKSSTARKTTLLNIHKSQVLDRNFFYVCLNYFEFKLR